MCVKKTEIQPKLLNYDETVMNEATTQCKSFFFGELNRSNSRKVG